MIQEKLKLSNEFKLILKDCDEIWIAVAMISEKGFNFIQDHICKKAKQNFIIGIEFTPDDDRLSEQRIVDTIIENFELLYPSYKLIKHNLNL